ncbi:Calmodulin-binding transcription activator [Melia azedarach]|uniref:Calmodulin-binding transcription activator n=1 Tax=Melia azedarach TaxID=155640 RepID=A0ACC1XZR3_MELAZ|nr:Calmodulin-binding transcription activator [Melia azedarach]
MADTRRFALGNQLDIEQLLLEAQHRWLRPAEICEILRNYQQFRIAPEPPNMPQNGSLFLFDRKVLRYFRKDGHNWRKKKDGKTVKEAHERLKAGSIDVLHCYYAHGEENENFQRRSYWMLEEELSHIVLVHYREVKGNRTNFIRIKATEGTTPYIQETEETIPNSEVEGSQSSSFRPNSYQMRSQTTDTTSLTSAQASEYEDVESVYNNQASSSFRSFLESKQPATEKIDAGLSDPYYPTLLTNNYQGKFSPVTGADFISPAQADKSRVANDAGLTYEPQKNLDFQSWEDVLQNCAQGIGSQPFPTFSSTQPENLGNLPKQGHEILGELFSNSFGERKEFGSHLEIQGEWQTSEDDSSHLPNWPTDQKLYLDSAHDPTSRSCEQEVACDDLLNSLQPPNAHRNMQNNRLNAECGHLQKSDSESNLTVEGKSIYYSAIKPHLFDGSTEEGLKKNDSFNRWMNKELGDVKESNMQSTSGVYWETVESENGVHDSGIPVQEHLDSYMLSPSISQDQLYSIIDFSPNWAYVGSEVKVLITGRFLLSQQEAEKCKWSCMFGEVEVPAEIVAGGVLRCHTPSQKVGRVPFYVTCSNRLACSEVREFEYRASHVQDVDTSDNYGDVTGENLRMRLGKLLCLSSVNTPNGDPSDRTDISQLKSKISSLLKEENDAWDRMLKLTENLSLEEVQEKLLQKLLKEKLHVWLLQKAAEGGKGPSVLDQDGQGVLHFAAALGYDWALEPTVVAGVNINFRDVNGWTALHWAAYCGRERTVASLISLGAAPGALSDPTPKYPLGRTPADLAASIGHKGIAGYLAESDLSSHLSAINLNKQDRDAAETNGAKVVQTVSQRSPTPNSDGDLPYRLSLKDSLAAVCNATQAAARIHQVFRVQSFQKKQFKEYGDDTFGISDERALSLLAVKSHKVGHHDEPVHAAAVRIQNKFRSWKGRKDFLIIRQQIVKIQAHVRGHQVRKNYRKIVWSVGIMEKVILRWRRKGSGLRGFKSEALTEGGSSMLDTTSKEDDFDFLKEGRKQKEERLQKALARVKSMVQYPEARDQYRRLLNVVNEIQETKAMALNNPEETADFDDDMINIEALLDDDIL